jgi:transaldolase
MPEISELKIKLFADGANIDEIAKMNANVLIKGLTTNPTLMKKSGVHNYKDFCLEVLQTVKEKPISFEVFSDEIEEMESQANKIASWAENVYVKIPITNTKGHSTADLIGKLSRQGIKVNVTAVMTEKQILEISRKLDSETPSYVSIFAGRIADTGQDPIPLVTKSLKILSQCRNTEIIWASPRELLNIFQADAIGCQIITATSDVLNKLSLIGYDLTQYSLDTVKMFYRDALECSYKI